MSEHALTGNRLIIELQLPDPNLRNIVYRSLAELAMRGVAVSLKLPTDESLVVPHERTFHTAYRTVDGGIIRLVQFHHLAAYKPHTIALTEARRMGTINALNAAMYDLRGPQPIADRNVPAIAAESISGLRPSVEQPYNRTSAGIEVATFMGLVEQMQSRTFHVANIGGKGVTYLAEYRSQLQQELDSPAIPGAQQQGSGGDA